MKTYVDRDKLQEYTTKLTAKNKTLFAPYSAVGSPLVASTVAEMTDTSKVYVYVGSESGYTSGNWYYHDGSDWVSGGVYNSTALVTDTTLTQAGMAADAKAAGDKINALSDQTGKNIFWVTDRTNRSINGVDFVFNDDGSITANGTAEGTINIYVMGDVSATSERLPAGEYTFTRWTVEGSGNIRIRNASTSLNIISSNNLYDTNTITLANATKICLQIGNNVTVHGTFRFQIETGSNATDYSPALPLYANDAKARILAGDTDKNFRASQMVSVQYRNNLNPTLQGATEGLFISVYGAKYVLVHSVDATTNCDCWRIYRALSTDEKKSITVNGEWECAIRMEGWSDFSGGYAHGNEVMVYNNNIPDISFHADGVNLTLNNMASGIECYEFRIQEASVLYSNLNPSLAVANHGKEYIFTADGLIIRQSLEWLIDGNLDRCYMAMLPAAKAYAEKYYTDTEFKMNAIPTQDDYSITCPNAKHVQIYGANTAYSFDIAEYPNGLTGGDVFLLTDNYVTSSTLYNKCYYRICNGGTIEQGTIWKTETRYKLRYIY